MKLELFRLTGLIGALALVACGDSGATDTSSSETGDGDGDPTTTGDGDGDPTTGDGDGDPTTTGDGDGDGDCSIPDDLEGGLDFVSSSLELTPGSSYDYDVGAFMCCVFWEPVDVCASYSVEPADAGATIDPDTGLLDIADDVPDGTTFTVSADVVNWPTPVEGEVFVYVPELHPLKGHWTEVARIPCDNGPEYMPANPIGELVFTAAGEARVTWTPFEIYVDYWADYSADLDTAALSIMPTGGNYVPDVIDGEGTYSFEGQQLVLHDIWLGSAQEAMDPPACGHRFE